MKRLIFLLLCAMSGSAMAQSPAPQASPEQLAAARRLVVAMELPRYARYSLSHTAGPDRESTEVMLHISQHVSDADLAAVLAPAYASHASAADMDRLATLLKSGGGRRMVLANLAQQNVIDGPKAPLYSPAEQAEIRAIGAQPANKAFTAAGKQIAEDAKRNAQAWRTQYYQAYQRQAMAALADLAKQTTTLKPGDPEPRLHYQPAGLKTLDDMTIAIANHRIMVANARVAMRADLDSYNLRQNLAQEKMVTAQGIADGRKALKLAEERMERYLRAIDAQEGMFRQKLQSVIPDQQSLGALEKGIASEYDVMVRFGENQRGLLDAYSRTLDFAESRLGKIHMQNGQLAFDDDADLGVFNTLRAQMAKLADEEAQLAKLGTSPATAK